MNNRIFLILIAVIVLLFIGVGVFWFLYQERTPLQPNSNKTVNQNINVNTDYCLAKIKANEEDAFSISRREFYSVLNFYTFCKYNNDKQNIIDKCKNYFGERRSNYCTDKFPYLVMLYYLKLGQKIEFVKTCQDYTSLSQNKKNISCDEIWNKANDANLEFCDQVDRSCAYLVTDSEKTSCAKIVNLSTPVDNILDNDCRNEIQIRAATSAQDCLSIKDDITKLICLSVYSKDACDSAFGLIDEKCQILETGNLKKFEDKYSLNNCCYENDPQQGGEDVGAVLYVQLQ